MHFYALKKSQYMLAVNMLIYASKNKLQKLKHLFSTNKNVNNNNVNTVSPTKEVSN